MRTAPKDRLALIERVLNDKVSVTQACRAFNVSRYTFYNWLKKYNSQLSYQNNLASLSDHKRKVKRFAGQSSEQTEEIIRRIIKKHPEWGKYKIRQNLPKTNGKPILSPNGVYKILIRLNLETLEKRKRYFKAYHSNTPVAKKFNEQDRLLLINKVVKQGLPVSTACKQLNVSRYTFYKWYKRYLSASPGAEKTCLKNKKRQISRYNGQATYDQEKAVLEIVKKHPAFGKYQIYKNLPTIAGKPVIGLHGVYNILKRHQLNKLDKRISYSQEQQTIPALSPATGWLDHFKYVLDSFAIKIAPAPPFIASIVKNMVIVFFSCFITIFFSLLWLRMISQAPAFQTKLGLIFATTSLLVGFFFFIYSMKYYLTLAIVLTFSRHSLDQRNDIGKNDHSFSFIEWFGKIFGVSFQLARSQENPVPENKQADSFQPSLESISLKRYPFISIHIPLYNEREVAKRILKACASMNYGCKRDSSCFEIIVCDDSTDETTEIVKDFAQKHNANNPRGPKIKVLHRSVRTGFKGAALANALKHMDKRTEFVAVFDADFVPYPDTLELFVKYFKTNNNNSEKYGKSKVAVVGGYQWHVLNKSENWITRGVRSEYAGSYVVERPGGEIMGLLKQISGSVYMIRADILQKIGWGTSITEDFELTLKLYEQGYKVVYTPYVQAPAECVSTLKRLIRQRMRWAEGHSHNIRKMFKRLILSPNLTLPEKLEFLYLAPYYLQAAFFLVGTFCWLISETVFKARLPFWTSLWGWSLVLTNFFALPLVNAVGLFLEESEEKDYLGLISFVFLSYILVPFQAYAAVKGFLEKDEGTWFRTPKTGKITDIFKRGKFYRWISGILPGKMPSLGLSLDKSWGNPPDAVLGRESLGSLDNSYLALATAHNTSTALSASNLLSRQSASSQFNSFKIKPKRLRWVGKTFLAFVLCLSLLIHSMAFNAQPVEATWYSDANYQYRKSLTLDSSLVSGSTDLSHFPVLISYSDTDLRTTGDGGHVTDANGYDIIFTSSDKTTKLDHEIEKYSSNATTGTIVMWVRIPTLSYNSDTEIYIYYGNSGISTSQENITSVWNENGANNFKMVQHLKESPANGVAGHLDSTSNNNDGTPQNFAGSAGSTTDAVGQISGADEFDGSDDYVDLPKLFDFSNTNLTIEGWVNPTSTSVDMTIFVRGGNGYGSGIFVESDGTALYAVRSSSGVYIADSNINVYSGWHYITGVLDYPNVKVYVDGVWKTTVSGDYITTNPQEASEIGADLEGSVLDASCCTGYDYLDGIIDEVRVSNIARSADWIKTSYDNQNNQGTGTGKFIKTLGNEEAIPELAILFIPIALAAPMIVKYLKKKKAESII